MATKICRNCKMTIDEEALICPHCHTHYTEKEIIDRKYGRRIAYTFIAFIIGICMIFSGQWKGILISLVSGCLCLFFWKRGSALSNKNK